MIKQRTLKKVFSTVGIGLHSGRKVRLTLRPAPPDTGLVFTRIDLKPPVAIKAEPERVNDTRMATTLDKDGARIATIEHLMSALSGLAIDNCYIDVDAPEIPIMDGSGSTFVFLIRAAGIEEQDTPRSLSASRRMSPSTSETSGLLLNLMTATNCLLRLISVIRLLMKRPSLLKLTLIRKTTSKASLTPAPSGL